jgi:type IV pilus assembly protein PilC
VKLGRQVRGALAYPIAVIIIMILVMIVLMTFVIPAFEGMFAEFGAKDALPALTKLVISLSKGFISYLPLIVVLAVGGAALATYFYRSPRGKRAVHRAILRIPIMGPVLQKIAVARFTRTLGTLLGSGVPILDALDIVAKTAGNVIVEEGLLYARARISEGKNMAEPLGEIKVFPGMVVQMVAVGEQTGALDTMLNKIADFYEEEVDVAVAALTALIEPVLMVMVGGMVGVVLVSMYLPIFDLAGKIKAE